MALGTDKHCAAAGGGSVLPSAGAPSAGALFVSRETAAAMLGLSVGGLALAMDRGELERLYQRCGRSIRFCLPAILIRAAGLSDPADLGRFCAGAGIRDLRGLLEFLGGSA